MYYSVKGTPPNLSPCFLVTSESITMSTQMLCLPCWAEPRVLHTWGKFTSELYHQALESFLERSEWISVTSKFLISLLQILLNGLHELSLSRTPYLIFLPNSAFISYFSSLKSGRVEAFIHRHWQTLQTKNWFNILVILQTKENYWNF